MNNCLLISIRVGILNGSTFVLCVLAIAIKLVWLDVVVVVNIKT